MAKQRNREQIQTLQKENKDIREQLKSRALTSAGSLNATGTDFNQKTEKELAIWKRKADEMKNKSIAKKKALLNL